jgi:hypothetical protein
LYGRDYWEEYRARDQTVFGHMLTTARLEMVQRHCKQVVDIGIGGGAFVGQAWAAGLEVAGSDINEYAIEWLEDHGMLWDGCPVEAMTFWDSIEHIEDPNRMLQKTQWAFISTPTYEDVGAVLKSKHFKPGEHLHYWSREGMILYMQERGFELVEMNEMETQLGREGITSFAFRRVNEKA